MLGHRDRPDAGPATAVGDAERLVQVEMRDVTAEVAGLRETEQGVEVGAVDVDLAAVLMDQGAHLTDALLVDAVGRGVGDHDRRQPLAVLLALATEVVEIDGTVAEGRDHHHPHARHDGGCGVGAVCARGDEADVALVVAP